MPEKAPDSAGEPTAKAAGGENETLGWRWAVGLAAALAMLLAAVEGTHWQELSYGSGLEQVVQQPAPVAAPSATRTEPSAPDPGDDP